MIMYHGAVHADHKSIGFLHQIMSLSSSDILSSAISQLCITQAGFYGYAAKAEEQRWEFVDLSTQSNCGEKLQMENTVYNVFQLVTARRGDCSLRNATRATNSTYKHLELNVVSALSHQSYMCKLRSGSDSKEDFSCSSNWLQLAV